MVETLTPSLLDRYVAATVRYRWLVVALAALFMLAVTAGARFIVVTNDYFILFKDDNPQLLAFKALENTYSATDRALIAVAPRKGSVFTREALGAVVELTDAAWETPYSSRVDSLTNYSHSEALGEDDLVVAPLVEDASSLSDADLTRVETIALDAIEIVGRLVSRDGRAAGVVINFVLPENHDQAVIEITEYLDLLLDQARARHPGSDYYMTGDIALNHAFAEATADDLQTLTPIVFLIIVAVTALFLRSILGTAAIVAVLMFAVNTTMGFAGWMGVVFSPTSFRRADHRHGGSRRGFDPCRHHRPAGHEARTGQECGDRRVVSHQCLSDISHIGDNRDWLPQPEHRRIAAFPRPGKLRGVRCAVHLRIHHDAPAGVACAPAAARTPLSARPGRLLRPLCRLRRRAAHCPALVRRGGGGCSGDRSAAHRVERQPDTVLR